MSWRTTEDASEDLSNIGLAGALAFGIQHSRSYVQRLVDNFDILALYPRMAPERLASMQTVRLFPCEAHHILYAIDGDDIVILRVLHHLQDWFELL